MKKLLQNQTRLQALGSALLALGLGLTAFGQPTDNPVEAHYGTGGYPTWVDDLKWDNVIDMSTYSNGADNFEKFENARDELYAAGGGVLYYPAGEYTFNLPDAGYGAGIGPLSRGLMLKSGVVIRGADLTAGAEHAVVRPSDDTTESGFYDDVTHTLEPQTVFVFPTQQRGVDPITKTANSAGELPRDWSLIGLTTGEGESTIADVDNIGVVNVKLDGGIIFWGYHTPRSETRNTGKWLSTFKTNWPEGAPENETWGGTPGDGTHYMDAINASAGWHTDISAGTGRLVFGVVIENGAPFNDMITLDRKATASSANAASDFAHYRFTGRIAAHGSNIFIGNNVIAKPSKNFVHEMVQNVGTRNVLFDYANHIGIDVNKSNYGGNQDNVTVLGDGTGYFFPNVIVRDNWVFSRGNKGFEVSGKWATLLNNHNERYHTDKVFPAGYITNPEVYLSGEILPEASIDAGGISFDGWTWQSSVSASDYMSRGYDLAGNNLWASHNSVINTGSIGNDGEGIMGQRHNNIETFSWAFTYNVQNQVSKGPGTFGENGWIGIYDMHAGGLLLLHNATRGTHGILKPESNWILDVGITDNAGSGNTAAPATGHASGTDYTTGHSDAVTAPINVTAAYSADGKAVEISYVDTASNELGFRVDRRMLGGEWQPVAYRPPQSLGAASGVAYKPDTVNWTYPAINPQSWVDYTVGDGTYAEYRVVAINAADDDSTGVSAAVSVGTAAPTPYEGGAIAFSNLDLGAIGGQDRWEYDGSKDLPADGVSVATGGLEWLATDGGEIPASSQHLYTQAGVGTNPKMSNWLAYTPVQVSGPVYVRFVAQMETRPDGSAIGGGDPYELFAGFTNNAAANGAPWNAYFAVKYPSTGVGAGVETTGSDGIQANEKVLLDQPMMVVAKYEVDGDGKLTGIKVWVNPTEDAEATPDHDIVLAAPGVVLAEQTHFKLRGQNMPVRLDHLTMAATWAEVVPAKGVTPPPQVNITTGSVSSVVGESATLTVSVASSLPVTYQWYKDGVAIDGATAEALVLEPVVAGDAGSYTVEVTSDAGTTTSDPIVVTVDMPAGELIPVFTETFDAIASEDVDGEGNPITVYAGADLSELGWNVHHSYAGVALDGLATGSDAPNDILNLTGSSQIGDFAIGEPRGYVGFFINNYPLYGQGEDGARPDLPGPHPVTGEYYSNRTLATFLWKEATVSAADRALLEQFNFVQGNRDAAEHQFFPAVRIGSDWYVYIVGDETLRDDVRILGRPAQSTAFGAETVFSSDQFSEGGAYLNHYNAQPYQFTWSESGWTALTFDGAAATNSTVGMVLGSVLEGNLPAGDITAIGVYAPENIENGGYNYNGLRIDSIELLAEAPRPLTQFAFTFNNEGDVGGLDRPIQAANWDGVYTSTAQPLVTSEAVFADLSQGVSPDDAPGHYKAGFLFVSGKAGQPAPEAFMVWTQNLNVVNTPQIPQGDPAVNPQTDWYAEPGSFTNDLGEVTFAELKEVRLRTRPRESDDIAFHFAVQLDGEWYVSAQAVQTPTTDWTNTLLDVQAMSYVTGVVADGSLATDIAAQTAATPPTEGLITAIGVFIDTNDYTGNASWARIDSIVLGIETPPGPVILTQPESVAVQAGGQAVFTVLADDSAGALSYQWLKDDVAIDGANSATLTLDPVTVEDAGNYAVEVSQEGAGKTRSAVASLTILADPVVTPLTISAGANGGSFDIDVTADLAISWTASSDVEWITITQGATGVGSETVRIAVASNSSVNQRSAALTIAGATVNVEQSGAAAFYDVFPTEASFAAAGGAGTIEITATDDAPWEAVNTADWISFDAASSGSGSGMVNYTVAANTGTQERVAVIQIAGFDYTVTQEGAGLPASLGTLYDAGGGAQGFYGSSWLDFGLLWPTEDGGYVVYTDVHKLLYLIGVDEDTFLVYDYALDDWQYVNAVQWPYLYSPVHGWLYYVDGTSSPRWYYSYAAKDYLQETQLGEI